MDISVSYKHKGGFQNYKLTQKNFLGRPVEVNEKCFIIFYNWMGPLKSCFSPCFTNVSVHYLNNECLLCSKQGCLLFPGTKDSKVKLKEPVCMWGGSEISSEKYEP